MIKSGRVSICIPTAVPCRLLAWRCSWRHTLLIRSTSARLMLPKPIRQKGRESTLPCPLPFPSHLPIFSITGFIHPPPPPPPFLCLILVSVFLPKSIGFTKCTNVFFQESQMHICSVYSKSKGDKRKVSFFIKCKQCRRKFIALSGINTSECSGKVELIKEAFVSSAL